MRPSRRAFHPLEASFLLLFQQILVALLGADALPITPLVFGVLEDHASGCVLGDDLLDASLAEDRLFRQLVNAAPLELRVTGDGAEEPAFLVTFLRSLGKHFPPAFRCHVMPPSSSLEFVFCCVVRSDNSCTRERTFSIPTQSFSTYRTNE